MEPVQFPQTIYYTVSDGFTSDNWPIWGDVRKIGTANPLPFQFTSPNRPSLLSFGGSIYCAYRGGYSNNAICYTKYQFTSDTWSDELTIPSQTTVRGPALFKNTINNTDYLYCVYVGTSGDNNLWWTRTADGINWDAAQRFPNNCTSNFEPAATVCIASSGTYRVPLCAFTAADGTLKYTQYLNGAWTAPTPFEYSQSSSAGPSMCNTVDNNLDQFPLCVYRDHNTIYLWTTRWWNPRLGSGWKQPVLINRDNVSNDNASVSGLSSQKMAFRGTMHGSIDDQNLYYSDYNGTQWRSGKVITNAKSEVGPALWVMSANNYLCVFRGTDDGFQVG